MFHSSLKNKIFLVILFPSVLLLFVIYLDYQNLSALGQSAETILSKNYKSIQAAQGIRQILERERNRILTALFHEPAPELNGEALLQEVFRLLTFCRENITEPGEEAVIDSLFAHYEAFLPLYRNLTAEDALNRTQIPPKRHYDFIARTALFLSDLNDLIQINEHAMERAENETQALAAKAMRYSLTLLALAILFTLIFSHLLAARIAKPLVELAGTLAQVREGSASYPKIPVTTEDEIGFLTAEFNRLFERLKVYDQISADELTAQKLKVRQAEKAKARFIADLSHQLKTPMTSLSMSIGILAEKGDRLPAEKRSRLLTTARDDCMRLSSLINELVNIARLEGMLEPRRREQLHLDHFLKECLRPLLPQAEEKKIRIETEIEPDLPEVLVDSLRFPWVITNLVGNAIRYSAPGGTVHLRVSRKGNRFYFQCADQGAGIEEKYLPRIFDRYTQFSRREESGTIGLGLAIVREIIEDHGGDIRVESRIGRGTTFTFWIPMESEASGENGSSHR